ncbi:MAG: hypothetical protein UW09_C0001G0006 [candidate division TM6 bacterium GW2011_GWF2_43_87]|nr:MAG: hypothetical protein UW09_C0001G0006 [candidate division TM6 bacterium GW2011_GWF2_43_87]
MQDLKVIDICIWNLKIDINQKDKTGQTPLHIAAQLGFKKVTKHLIIQGANLAIKDNSEKTAADVGTPQTAAYIRLAQDFGNAALHNKMLFKTFAEKWLTADNFIRFTKKLLFVQPFEKTEIFTNNFYSWCQDNDKISCLFAHKVTQKPTKPTSPLFKRKELINTDLIKEKKSEEKFSTQLEQESQDSEVIVLNSHPRYKAPEEEKNLIVLEPTPKKATTIILGGSQLHQAAAEGNLILLEKLLLAGKDICSTDDQGRTPFDVAVQANQADVAWLLLLADKTYRASANKIPFKLFANMYLMTEENSVFIKKLITNLDPEFLDRINKFLEEKPKKELQKVEKTLVKSTNKCQHLPRVIQLIDDISPEKFKQKDEISRKKIEYNLISQFRKIKGSLKEISLAHNTALHYTAQWNMPTVASFLIKNGIDINATNLAGDTALHTATYNNNLAVILVLVKNHADCTIKNDEVKTALMLAAEHGNLPLLKFFAESIPSPTSQVDQDGNTVLHTVAKINNIEAIRCLHKAGFDLNVRNNKKKTPLHVAVAFGANENISELIKLGATLTPDSCGKTPLHYAIELENEEMVYMLAKQGASVLKKNLSVQTAYDSARERLTTWIWTGPSKIKLRRIVDYLGILIELHLVRENSVWAQLLAKNSTLIMQVPLLCEGLKNEKTLTHPALILLKQRACAYTLQCKLKKIQPHKKLQDCRICFKK